MDSGEVVRLRQGLDGRPPAWQHTHVQHAAQQAYSGWQLQEKPATGV